MLYNLDMAMIDYFLLCETIIRDEAGRITIVNTFDALNIPEFPAIPAKFALVLRVYPDKDDLKNGMMSFKIDIVDPKGDTIKSVSVDGKINNEIIEGRQGVALATDLAAQVTIKEAGTYTAVLLINKKEVRKKRFEVNYMPASKEVS